MAKSSLAINFLSIWVLLNGVPVASGLAHLAAKSPWSAIRVLGVLPVVGWLFVGFLLFRRRPGARIVASFILGWTSFGLLGILVKRAMGVWPHPYTWPHQLATIAVVLCNLAAVAYMWRRRATDPFSATEVLK